MLKLATQGKVKHFVAGKPATRVQRLKVVGSPKVISNITIR